jgi:hypothetical protein
MTFGTRFRLQIPEPGTLKLHRRLAGFGEIAEKFSPNFVTPIPVNPRGWFGEASNR